MLTHMKLNRYITVLAATLMSLTACEKAFDGITFEGGDVLQEQNQTINTSDPTRSAAAFSGLFTHIGQPNKLGYGTPDDFGVLMMLFCNDLESADALIADSGYNWFSVCGEYSSRSATYRNPVIRYKVPYNIIAAVNEFIAGYPEDVDDPEILNMIAQAKCLRAYSYQLLAPSFQFAYTTFADPYNREAAPCVPICSPEIEDPAHNPRASVGEIYDIIVKDLTEAVAGLEGATRSSKSYIDQSVAYGLRARAYLNMGKYEEALADAKEAAKGYTPASIEEVSVPAFNSIDEHNWMWGFYMTADMASAYTYATTSSWLRSFSGDSYSAAVQCYTMINSMLYNKIPATDVRKGWWVDENLESPLLETLTWDSLKGQEIGPGEIEDVKMAFLPYTNVKFACNTLGTTTNDEDFPLMRVEEMILIQAECLANLNKDGEATSVLEDFVKTYRDPSYSASGRGLSLKDEIWFQRRVELWGEGFGIFDTKRLNKPLVRFLGTEESTNQPTNFRFNMKADDPWLLMKFANAELNTNLDIIDNKGGSQPTIDQNPELRDGVTD